MNLLHPTIQPTVPKRIPKNMVLGYRACHRDLRSRNGFRWGFPGQWTEATGPFGQHDSACPINEGDGICIARTMSGAASGDIPGGTYLLVAYATADVLGEDSNKVRVKRALTLDVFTYTAFAGPGANLSNADLHGANLSRANLSGADLHGANLAGADLRGTSLRGANLTSANLSSAYLYGTYLSNADLHGAYLSNADLHGANLSRADLSGAYLSGAYLYGAYADAYTRVPSGWVVASGRIVRAS